MTPPSTCLSPVFLSNHQGSIIHRKSLLAVVRITVAQCKMATHSTKLSLVICLVVGSELVLSNVFVDGHCCAQQLEHIFIVLYEFVTMTRPCTGSGTHSRTLANPTQAVCHSQTLKHSPRPEAAAVLPSEKRRLVPLAS